MPFGRYPLRRYANAGGQRRRSASLTRTSWTAKPGSGPMEPKQVDTRLRLLYQRELRVAIIALHMARHGADS